MVSTVNRWQRWVSRPELGLLLPFSFYLACLLAVFATNRISAQQRYAFNKLTSNEGLSQASNDYIYQDSKGFVWLSSLDGLNRFDGEAVTVYKSISGDSTSLLGNIITSNFFEDSFSNLWFTTYEGVHCYLRERDSFLRFQLKDSNGNNLRQDYRAFHLNEHELWVRVGIGAEGRLHLFDLTTHTNKIVGPLDGQKNFPVTDSTGKVLRIISSIFDDRYGVEVMTPQVPSVSKPILPDSDSRISRSVVGHINTEDPNNWYLSSSSGLFHFRPEAGKSQLFDTFRNQDIGNVTSTVYVNDSTLWVATQKQSILVFDTRRSAFTGQLPRLPQSPVGLPESTLNQLWKDRHNNVWITSREGVAYTNLDKKKFVFPYAFEGKNITALFESSRGDVFCSYGSNHTAYFAGGADTFRTASSIFPEGQQPGSIEFFFESGKGKVWAVSGRSLLKWEPIKHQFEYVQPIPGYVLYCYQSADGTVLFATYQGIYRGVPSTNNRGFQIAPVTALGTYQPQLATAIFTDQRNRLYLALDASRLIILDKGPTGYSMAKEISGIGYAKAFLEEEASIWVATTTGLLQIDANTLSSRILNDQDDGIPQNTYYSVIKSGEAFWLSTNRGIAQYRPKTNRFHTYTLLDGLQGNEFNSNAYLKTNSGEVWMGGTNGLNRFTPASIKVVPHIPSVHLTNILVNDESFPTTPQVEEITTLTLPYFQNTVSFDFVALEYSDPGSNRYQYKMDNLEDKWVDAGVKSFARYSNLSPGWYTFRVKGTNSDGVWSANDRVVTITVTPPWWRRWWFYLGSVAIVAALIYGAFFYQLQQALKLERLRVKISSDLHDDVGGILSGLAMQSEILSLTATEATKPKLNRIAEMSRSAMSRMRDTVWAIDTRRSRLEDLIERMIEHAEETLPPKSIRYSISYGQLNLKKNLAADVRQSLYLIYKEAITNVAKHSTGDTVAVKLQQLPEGFTMTIHDNGEAAPKKYNTTGQGQSNMRMRAESIGATLDIDLASGFKITLRRKSI